jgi:hypothetical protein
MLMVGIPRSVAKADERRESGAFKQGSENQARRD